LGAVKSLRASEVPVLERGLSYEELEPGRKFRTGRRRVTQADVTAFAAVSGDHNPLHLDEAYAGGSVFGRRVAHGVLGLAVATGLINELGLTRGTLVAFLGVSWDFVAPLLPDSEVEVELAVESRRETSRPGRGLVVMRAALMWEGSVVQEGEMRFLVKRE
jgi:acyl dehydratase